MQDLTVEQFAAHLNESFAVEHESSRLSLTLVEAVAKGARPSGRQPFALLFRGPLEPVLPQATYRFERATFPSLDIFIVPIGPDGDGMRYEAIFG